MRFKDLFLSLDSFGTRVSFLVKGDSQYRSIYGVLVSLLVAIIVISYSSVKMITLIQRDDTNH